MAMLAPSMASPMAAAVATGVRHGSVRTRPSVQEMGRGSHHLQSCGLRDGLVIGLVWGVMRGGTSVARRSRRRSLRGVATRRSSWEDEQSYLTPEERAQMAAQMDDSLAPFRNIVCFLGLLFLGKAVPDALFSVLKHWAGMRGSEYLDFGMLGFDGVIALAGAGMIYGAFKYLGPTELPSPGAVAAADAAVEPRSSKAQAAGEPSSAEGRAPRPAMAGERR
mmetsp:Transcript_29814/g.67559  ORF Transcript_29814/g.67559 Transcript_29814/m.67559 type:complete len:221 (+) Transcript_29814:51-713(+)